MSILLTAVKKKNVKAKQTSRFASFYHSSFLFTFVYYVWQQMLDIQTLLHKIQNKTEYTNSTKSR